MAITVAAIAIVIRLVGVHHVFPETLGRLPIVPVATLLMTAALIIDWLRGRVTVRVGLIHAYMIVFFSWAAISLAVNRGADVLADFAVGDVAKDLFFTSILMLLVDRLSRLRVVVAAILISLFFIGVFGLPQLWGPRFCAEWRWGDMINLKFDGRPCETKYQCYSGTKPPRAFKDVGERLYRCERMGPFGISAYFGRLRWVGVLSSTNTLAAAIAFAGPLVLALMFPLRTRLRRIIAYGGVGFLAIMLFATGSRGQTMAFAVGLGTVAVMRLGRRAILPLAFMGLVVGGSLALTRAAGLRQARDTRVSTIARLRAARAAFDVWSEYPVLGAGFKQFTRLNPLETHNTFLQAAADLGTVGLLLLALLIWATVKVLLGIFFQARRRGRSDLAYWATMMLASQASMVTTFFLISWTGDLLWQVWLTLGNGFIRSAQRELGPIDVRFTAWDALIALAAVLLLQGVTYLVLMSFITLSLA